MRSEAGRIPSDIERRRFDALIIGAGINGCGIARDAALRGIDVLLIDKADIGGETTAWSTRLIHGGLRYLEHGEVGLVRESLRERETLLHIAPHLVRPLEFLVPIYGGSRRGPLQIRAGMLAYDALALDSSLPRHSMLGRESAARLEPGLREDDLTGAALYFDAQVTFPERLALENALDAVEHGATLLTYLRARSIETTAQQGATVTLVDKLQGDSLRVHARVVVNASGPWVDVLLTGLNEPRQIGGTRGSHIIVAPFAGAPGRAVYVEAPEDGRPFFIVPWNGLLLIGTTDLHHDGDPTGVRAMSPEVDYLIRQTNAVFADAELCPEGVRFTYAGVRPLPHSEGRLAGAITRRHQLRRHRHAPGVLSVIGGKLTTYRNLAEQAVNAIYAMLASRPPNCTTAALPLPGARDQFVDASAHLPIATSRRLRALYGSRAVGVERLAASEPSLSLPLVDGGAAIGAEIAFAFEHEHALTLDDALFRRTMLGLVPDLGYGVFEPALILAARRYGWSAGRIRDERERYDRRRARHATPPA